MIRRFLRSEGAQSLVEFSMIAPLFLILVMGVIDFGFGLKSYISVSQATREGARYASIGNASGSTYTTCGAAVSGTVIKKVCDTMTGLSQADISSITVVCTPSCASGNSVKVSAAYKYKYITPVKALVNFFSAGSLPGYLTVSSSTDMRIE